jgi:hypothetical protein
VDLPLLLILVTSLLHRCVLVLLILASGLVAQRFQYHAGDGNPHLCPGCCDAPALLLVFCIFWVLFIHMFSLGSRVQEGNGG